MFFDFSLKIGKDFSSESKDSQSALVLAYIHPELGYCIQAKRRGGLFVTTKAFADASRKIDRQEKPSTLFLTTIRANINYTITT